MSAETAELTGWVTATPRGTLGDGAGGRISGTWMIARGLTEAAVGGTYGPKHTHTTDMSSPPPCHICTQS